MNEAGATYVGPRKTSHDQELRAAKPIPGWWGTSTRRRTLVLRTVAPVPQHTDQLKSDNPGTQFGNSSPNECEAALQELLRDVQASEIDPRGAWISRARNCQADFEIQVVELNE